MTLVRHAHPPPWGVESGAGPLSCTRHRGAGRNETHARGHAIQSIDDIVKEYRPAVFDVEGEDFKIGENKSVQNILIGPEGGFSLRELDLFRYLRLDIYKVGETVLKTETAAIVMSGLVVLE